MSETKIRKLAIIAGTGYLPKHVLDACKRKKIDAHVIGIDGEVSVDIFKDEPIEIFKIHKISKILKRLKELDVSHVTLAGKVRRADISKLLLDIKGAKLFALIVTNGLADNAILRTIIQFLESENLQIIAPEKIAPEITVTKGTLTKIKPNSAAEDDIKQGVKILKGVATYDVGQALIIQNGLVLGIEAAEGTDELIKRCGDIKQEGQKPVLIKVCKPLQDKRVDLPCIGPSTIENAHKNGIQGIAVEANQTLVLDQDKTIKLADQYKIFIVGV